MNASTNGLAIATTELILGLLLSGYRQPAKERSDVAALQQPIGVGKHGSAAPAFIEWQSNFAREGVP